MNGQSVGRRGGFSLIEAIVAILVLSLCIGGLSGLMMMSRQSSDMARDRYMAVNICKNRLERIKTFEFGQLHLFAETATDVDANGNPVAGGHFRRSTTVTEIRPNLVEVTVDVRIRNRITRAFGDPVESLSTYVADLVFLGDE